MGQLAGLLCEIDAHGRMKLPPSFAPVDNTTSIDVLKTDLNVVALVTDPETRATVILVDDASSDSEDEY